MKEAKLHRIRNAHHTIYIYAKLRFGPLCNLLQRFQFTHSTFGDTGFKSAALCDLKNLSNQAAESHIVRNLFDCTEKLCISSRS